MSEHDPDKDVGLYDKYLVYKATGNPEGDDFGWEPITDPVFVLNPQKDSLAVEALYHYAKLAAEAGYEQLADDLYNWLDT